MATFTWGPGGSRMTPEDIATQRKFAQSLLASGMDYSPIASPWQGAARVAQALLGGYQSGEADFASRQNATESNDMLAKAVASINGGGAAIPASTPAVATAPTVPSASTPGADLIRSGLIERGIPEPVADGFLMNFRDESGLNPAINEAKPLVPGSRGGFGLAQWTGPRRVALEQFAANAGRPVDDVNTQLDFLVNELKGPEAAAAQSFMGAQTPQDAAVAIAKNFLRPAPENLQRRVAQYSGGMAQAVPAAQVASRGINPAILELVTSPYVSDSAKKIGSLLFQQQLQQQDPMRQLQAAKLQQELTRGQPLINAGGGQLYNPNNGQWINAPDAGKQKPTPLMQNLLAAGLQPGTPEYRDAILQNVTKPQTQVNMTGEKAWDQESAKLFAKRYDGISAGAMNAQQMLGMYDLAEQALNSGVRTGIGAEAELTLRQMGAAMGMDTDPKKLAGGELIRAVQNRMALTMRSPDGGMGMPGALSDRDIKFLKDSQIGIDRSPEGNRRMLEAFRAMESRKIEIARLADDYVMQNGRLDSGFNQMVREYAQANPLFPEVESGGAPQAGQVVDGYRFKGGDPADPNSWERQ